MSGIWDGWTKAAGVITAGEDKVKFCAKESAGNTTPAAFTEGDFIGELNDMNGFGSSRETSTINGYRYDSAAEIAGKATPNQVTLQLNLTKADLDRFRGYYNDRTVLAVGIFDTVTSGDPAVTTYPLIYGYTGQIASWGMEIPNGETASLTVTMSIIADNVAHTFSAS